MNLKDRRNIGVGVNDIMNGKSKSNIKNLLRNIQGVVKKCNSYGVLKVFASGIPFTVKIPIPTLERIHEKMLNCSRIFDFIYIDKRNTRGFVCLWMDFTSYRKVNVF